MSAPPETEMLLLGERFGPVVEMHVRAIAIEAFNAGAMAMVDPFIWNVAQEQIRQGISTAHDDWLHGR